MSSNYRDHLQLLAFGFQSHIISLNLENSTGVIGKLQEPCNCAKSFIQGGWNTGVTFWLYKYMKWKFYPRKYFSQFSINVSSHFGCFFPSQFAHLWSNLPIFYVGKFKNSLFIIFCFLLTHCNYNKWIFTTIFAYLGSSVGVCYIITFLHTTLNRHDQFCAKCKKKVILSELPSLALLSWNEFVRGH